jgi:23S rRNA (uracil1939-C5)-methyltransferase
MPNQSPNPKSSNASMYVGAEIDLAIEKPAAGGRMIARHDGQVVLVQGAIPGERVTARIERVEPRLAFASTVQVREPSSDRTDPGADPLCGGCLYAHIGYPRQLAIKAEVIADAFGRLGRIPLESEIVVAASPQRGYRMRARLHVRGSRLGFYREGTHELCDASATGQLTDAAIAAAAAAVGALAAAGSGAASIEFTENVAADERAVHVEPVHGAEVTDAMLDGALRASGLTGCTARTADGVRRTAGVPVVRDPLATLTGGRAAAGDLQRHAESFFQANRFLLPRLVSAVVDAVPAPGDVLDLYAGVGLFAVSLGAMGRERITAVEGDRSSATDLRRNAAACAPAIRVVAGTVEEYLARRAGSREETIIVDPPRTGISKAAMDAVVRRAAGRVVYLSCDPATMARDARRLLDGGYTLSSLEAFDLFPNTPHVEAVGVFDRK